MTDDLLDEATRLADYIGAHEDWEPAHVAHTDAATVRALIERVRQAEEALRDVPCEHQRAGYLRMQAERDEWHQAAMERVLAILDE